MPASILAGLLPLYIIRFSLFGIPTNLFEVLVGIVFVYSLPKIKKNTLPRSILILITLFIFSSTISLTIIPNLSQNFPGMSLEHGLGIFKSWIIVPIIFGYIATVRVAARGVPQQARSLGEHLMGVQRRQDPLFQYLTLSGTVVAAISFFIGPSSVYDVPNSLALFLTPLIIIAFWHNEWFKFCIMGLALLYTQSLGGILATIITLTASLLTQRKAQAKIWLLCFGLLAFFGFCVLRFEISEPGSARVRLQLWSISQEIIADHPTLGIGLGQFEPVYQNYSHKRFKAVETGHAPSLQPIPEFVFRDPHNWILAFWLNTGLIGLVSFSLLNIFALYRAYRFGFWALFFGLAALLLHGLVDTIYWKNDLAALHWLLLFIALSAAEAEAHRDDRPN